MGRLSILVMALMLMLAGAGCAAPPPAAITVMVSGDPAERAVYEALVTEYTRRFPDRPVTLLHIPGTGDYLRRLELDIAAGAPADVVLLNYRRIAGYAARGDLLPLDVLLDDSTSLERSAYYPQALAAFVIDGATYGIPQNVASLVVYLNRDMFAAAGQPLPAPDWRWDDLRAAARALTRDRDGDGMIDQYGFASDVSFYRLIPFIWQAGGTLVDDQLAPRRLTLDTPEARTAFEWFVGLYTRDHVAPDAVAEAATSAQQRFIAGEVAMFLDSRRGVPTYRASAAFDWDVAPLPRAATAAGVLHADGFCIPRASDQQAAAWHFVEFAAGPIGQTLLARAGRIVPALRAVAESPAFLDPSQPPASARVFLDQVPLVRTVPAHPAWQAIETVADEEFERAVYGFVTVDDAIAQMMRRSQPLFMP
jgi:multiple sugar transport system substrate-binding protein